MPPRKWFDPRTSFKKISKKYRDLRRKFTKSFEIFKEHVADHWPRYVLSLVTSTFTYHAAYTITGQVYYGIMAIMLSEGMWLYWFSRLETFENYSQMIVSLFMWIIGGVSIFLTDIASALLIASENNVEGLSTVLPILQGISITDYITKVTPILAASNLISYALYEFFSDTNRDKRQHEKEVRSTHRYIRRSERELQRTRAEGRVLRRRKEVDKMKATQIKKYGKKEVENNSASNGSWVETFERVMKIIRGGK